MSPTKKAVRVRKNIATLGAAGDDLDWYGKAVALLKTRPITDPTSWRYLGAVHGYPGAAGDPFKKAGEKRPSAADQTKFWDQCQHQTWFFLSWHRGYLACFEEIVADAVVEAGGPTGWALPYWNYSAGTVAARRLPPAFVNPTVSGGKANPLWLAGRAMASATAALPASHVDLSALLDSQFAGTSTGGSPGFGGPKTGFSHFGGTNGLLENVPHNQVHVDVGGLMSDPNTAALDPIFWVHHANIDRLWEVWRNRSAADINPTSKNWLTGTTFRLHDAHGKVVKFNSSQMRDTTKVRHGYRYDDITDPLGAPLAPPPPSLAAPVVPAPPPPPQLVGASESAVDLADGPTTTHVTMNQPARREAIARVPGRPVRAFLNLENVTGPSAAGTYDVYVNVPKAPGSSHDSAPPLLAGHLSTFGVAKASRRDSKHGGGGITTVLEITPLIARLHAERQWDGQRLEVAFQPSRAEGVEASREKRSFKIGRISVYYG